MYCKGYQLLVALALPQSQECPNKTRTVMREVAEENIAINFQR